MEQKLLHLGCMIYNRFPDYELSAKTVLEEVGIEPKDMHHFACCSSTLLPSFSEEWLYLATYNLALAEERGLDIVTLCGTCTATFKRANRELESRQKLEEVNHRLGEVGMGYGATTRVEHILELLWNRRERVEEKVNALDTRVALQHPCNVFRPGHIANFDDPLEPTTLRELLGLVAGVVEYPNEYQCCGSTLDMEDRALGARAGAQKLLSARRAGADVMAVACGNCAFLFDKKAGELKGEDRRADMKTFFFTQLLALAMRREREAALDIRGLEIE